MTWFTRFATLEVKIISPPSRSPVGTLIWNQTFKSVEEVEGVEGTQIGTESTKQTHLNKKKLYNFAIQQEIVHDQPNDYTICIYF